MALSIKNPKAEKLARELAAESGESITQAITCALEERLEQIRGRSITTDLAAQPRIVNGTVDRGAYEFQPATAAFSASPTSGPPPLLVTFTDLSPSSPDQWHWSFGDGDVSTAQNPTHTYSLTGSFAVTLVITGPFGTATTDSPFHILATNVSPTYFPIIMKNH